MPNEEDVEELWEALSAEGGILGIGGKGGGDVFAQRRNACRGGSLADNVALDDTHASQPGKSSSPLLARRDNPKS